MTLNQWRKAVASWTVEEDPKRVDPPTEADLDEFERQFNFRLPDSYRRFAMLMGAGTLADSVRFYSPACDDGHFDMIGLNKHRRRHWEGYSAAVRHDVDPADMPQLERLLVMANSVYGDDFYWDPEDTTLGPGHEHGIYLVRRLPRRAEKVAATFDSFVFDFCLGARFHDFYSKDDDTDRTSEGLPMERWSPARARRKKSKKAD